MFTRVLYTPAGTGPDFGAGRSRAALLVADPPQDDLQMIVEEGWLAERPIDGVPYLDRVNGTFDHQVRNVHQLRREVARRLDELLAAARATFGTRQVDRHRVDGGDQPGVEAQTTGGPDREDNTDAYRAWDILSDHHRLPTGWGAAINHAIGFIDHTPTARPRPRSPSPRGSRGTPEGAGPTGPAHPGAAQGGPTAPCHPGASAG
jgi:hypothetical protein